MFNQFSPQRIFKHKRFLLTIVLLVFALFANACASVPISSSNTPSSLDPHGPGAAHIADLWWIMLGFGVLITFLVYALLMAAIMRRRRATSETSPDTNENIGIGWLLWGGIILPLIVLAIVFVVSIGILNVVSTPQEQAAMTIKVIGRRWWWQVDYPAAGVTTANEIHVITGVPIRIELQSADVIHSFWVPQLTGKMDAIPAKPNALYIQADQAGVYRGQCAEFCGLQHAHMGFMVVAESKNDFDQWISNQQKPVSPLQDDAAKQGQQVFFNAGCVFCHTINGLDDKSIDASKVDLGPDLTHLSSRSTIAGASLNNTRGNLAGWIVDAQHVKPGSLMPPMYLQSQDLLNLLVYLETLK
jgi:cytochrome c oxidase subunit 2